MAGVRKVLGIAHLEGQTHEALTQGHMGRASPTDHQHPQALERLGLAGMPRRYADYPMQFADFNAIASVGALGFGLMQVYFFLAVIVPAMRGKGEKAAAKPWDGAEGLEWEVPSPAPFHTFENPPKLDATATRVIG